MRESPIYAIFKDINYSISKISVFTDLKTFSMIISSVKEMAGKQKLIHSVIC